MTCNLILADREITDWTQDMTTTMMMMMIRLHHQPANEHQPIPAQRRHLINERGLSFLRTDLHLRVTSAEAWMLPAESQTPAARARDRRERGGGATWQTLSREVKAAGLQPAARAVWVAQLAHVWFGADRCSVQERSREGADTEQEKRNEGFKSDSVKRVPRQPDG